MLNNEEDVESFKKKEENICDKIIDNIEFTTYHVKMTILLNLYIGGEGLLMVGNSLLTPVIANVWNLSEFEKGFIGGTIFLGFTLGALFSGMISDKKGRKVAFVGGNMISLVGAIVGSFSTSAWHLAVSNFLIGVGLGQSIPSIFSLCSEATGDKVRNFLINITFISFVAGEILVCLIARNYEIYNTSHSNWRILLYLRIFTVIIS